MVRSIREPIQVYLTPAERNVLDRCAASSAAHLREHGADISLATYDGRMREAGVGMGFELYLEA